MYPFLFTPDNVKDSKPQHSWYGYGLVTRRTVSKVYWSNIIFRSQIAILPSWIRDINRT